MAKFSKAHYVILAKVFKSTEESVGDLTCPTYFLPLKQNLIAVLLADNPKFDATRFLKASEPEVTR